MAQHFGNLRKTGLKLFNKTFLQMSKNRQISAVPLKHLRICFPSVVKHASFVLKFDLMRGQDFERKLK
jgi:hypothetical protein